VATGSYSHATTADITSAVAWGTDAVSHISIDANGLATALSPGTSAVTATLGAVSGSASLSVDPIAPSIVWPKPFDISYGTALGAIQLNASALDNGQVVPGTFAYTPAAGTVLGVGANQALSVVFTPTDAATYSSVAASTTINVVRATPIMSWATPASIIVGTPLGAAQLNATASVPGKFTYTPAKGTVLGVGNRALSVSFVPTDSVHYAPTTAVTTIAVRYRGSATTCNGAPGHNVLQPVNANGSSVFKAGSTVQIQLRVCNAQFVSVGTPGVVSAFTLIGSKAGTTGAINETVSNAAPFNTFRWDTTKKAWVLNLSTTALAAKKTYTYRITLNDTTAITFKFGVA
jgi:hypothetical protein